jgi:hypothetical protein
MLSRKGVGGWLLSLAAVTLFATGCGAGVTITAATAQDAVTAPPQDGLPVLVVRNASFRSTICYVHFSLTSDPNWGSDRLGRSETIRGGMSRAWRVPAGTYDVRLVNCVHRELGVLRGVTVAGEGVVITFR